MKGLFLYGMNMKSLYRSDFRSERKIKTFVDFYEFL